MNDDLASFQDYQSAIFALGTDLTQFQLLDFKPLSVLEKLSEIQKSHSGQSAVVLIARELHAHFLWNYEEGNLQRLMILKRQGAWIVGFMAFPPDGSIVTYAESQTIDAPLFQSILNTWAGLYQQDPDSRTVRELNELTTNYQNKMRTCHNRADLAATAAQYLIEKDSALNDSLTL